MKWGLGHFLFKRKSFILGFICFFLATFSCQAENTRESWNVWLSQLREEALAKGIKSEVFDAAFMGVTPNRTILKLDKQQPERRLTFLEYRHSRIDPLRIRMGRQEFRKYQLLFSNIGRDFNVDPCFVDAFWGIETSYGHYMGHFPVIRALATLAYDNRRSQYFRKELFIALQILNEGHISLDKFKGEWAGASGQCQFMPSSWERYAVDYEGDGKKNIWTSYADGLASIANYLHLNGWQRDEPWAVEVNLPPDFDEQKLGLKTTLPVSEWLQLGVKPLDLNFLKGDNTKMASIVKPEGGPVFMVFNNFKVLLKYNNSIFYAASVGYLADKICQRH